MAQIFGFCAKKWLKFRVLKKMKIHFDHFLKYLIFKYLNFGAKIPAMAFFKNSRFLARKFKYFANEMMNVIQLARKIENKTSSKQCLQNSSHPT